MRVPYVSETPKSLAGIAAGRSRPEQRDRCGSRPVRAAKAVSDLRFTKNSTLHCTPYPKP